MYVLCDLNLLIFFQLHDVLAESDRALAVVRDLFGDDPKVGWYYTSQLSIIIIYIFFYIYSGTHVSLTSPWPHTSSLTREN